MKALRLFKTLDNNGPAKPRRILEEFWIKAGYANI
jgi:hypothetical protein